ncbi:hypothetical protein SAMN05216223_102401 [Actinacidiphila yanglinensis]|uniref:CU044_5270 family protein n=1 Tax=Actinacidiphila yanglinensis TaxID=310779 RepID=A0A1H5VQY6_9ACTN|nr:CU044_5270 family protein [Actinacidiphila yanglinensis]SEF89692.1 hypothetical protein SAMN05216223_102401 [Actinacidiphila yanglinensis]
MSTDAWNQWPDRAVDGTGRPELDALAASGEVAPPSTATVAVARAALRAAVEREEQAAAVPAVRRRIGRPRRWIAAGVAVAAVATGAAVIPVVDIGGRTAARASAATFLDRTAGRAAAAAPHQGTYWKVETVLNAVGVADRRTTWYINRDTSRFVAEVGTAPTPLTGYTVGPWKWGSGRTAVTWDQLSHLPTGTAALRKRLTGSGGAHELFRTVGSLLATSPADPALRAALFRVLAGTPGIHLDGTATDSRGRSGTMVSVGYTTGGSDRLLIDPRTAALLEGTYKQGSLRTTYVFAGWTSRIG